MLKRIVSTLTRLIARCDVTRENSTEYNANYNANSEYEYEYRDAEYEYEIPTET